MEPDEAHSQSFIVKIWIEETASGRSGARWRGYITHVPDGKRRYVEHLEPISGFIAMYLKGMGVRFNWWTRLALWRRRGAD